MKPEELPYCTVMQKRRVFHDIFAPKKDKLTLFMYLGAWQFPLVTFSLPGVLQQPKYQNRLE